MEYLGIVGAILSARFITVDLVQLNAFCYCVCLKSFRNPSACLCSLCNEWYTVGNIKERGYLFCVYKISECPTRGAIVFAVNTLIKLHGLILWLSRRYSFIAKHLDSKRFDRKKLKLFFNYITTCQHCDRCLCQLRIVRRDGKYFWVQDGIYRSFRVSRDLINDAL